MIVAVGLTMVMYSTGAPLIVLGVLLPTLIHVSLLTPVFMTLGAYRSGSKAQALLIVVYLAAVAAILLVPPSARTIVPTFGQAAREYFGNVAPALGSVLGIPDLTLDTRFTSLLAFIYSYHYLNWFIKADVIRWADIPRSRLILVCAASAASTALYAFNYALGFTVLLALSLLHVVLEFPLNTLALRQLGAAIGQAALARSHQRA